MSKDSSAARSPKSTTRKSTTRYSLNVLGKALADVMNKDHKDTSRERAMKKPRDISHSLRRASATSASTNGTVDRHSSIGERPLAQEDTFSPEETITRTARRRTTLLKDATSPASLAASTKAGTPLSPAVPTRRSTLRPRTLGNASALPKYRPRSALVESNKVPPSPPRLGTRKRVSSSDEEKDTAEDVTTKRVSGNSPPQGKTARPISPLPQRALPANPAAEFLPPASAKPFIRNTPSPVRNTTTPPPNMIDRSSKPNTPSRSAIPRPPSSTSSSSSLPTPRTPTRQDARGNKPPYKGGASLRNQAHKQPESPLGQFAKSDIPKILKTDQFSRSLSESGSSSAFTEGDSIDDIEFMLGSVVSPTAPTPALPRLRDRHQHGDMPQTPSRLSNLPTRTNLSYLSPMPPPAGDTPSLRLMRAGNDRGSLLSWDQLVAVGNRTLGEGEAENMIADIPAPFSPAPSTVDLESTVPESPSLSALPSPAGYGSISQILLPDVTPSPAPTKHMQSQFISEHGRPAAADASLVVMLRLQLASMENIARERLDQIAALEAQLSAAKEARLREAADLAAQVSALEKQMHVSLENRERAAEDHAILEEQLRGAAFVKELAVQEAIKRVMEDTTRLRASAEETIRRKWEVACGAHAAATSWASVREIAEGELEFVMAQRETLNVLLTSL
ncbi:hypothetical protein B0F90DRAFT_107942 [Multifurca ochricompacta]|uniref:Uncharacterized protein n=1 Tax=Multifurca ochricompacta TaxID=376703 RepID=A0AAD4MGK9_9AGAM|nr:hypothetical protein B0F90DRAFT_107942 [Multifurca ochricompacta]